MRAKAGVKPVFLLKRMQRSLKVMNRATPEEGRRWTAEKHEL